MVFEVLGDNLLKLIIQHKYKGLPLPTVKSITAQVHYVFSHINTLMVVGTPWALLHACPLWDHSHGHETRECSGHH